MYPIILVSNDDGYSAKGIDSLLHFISPVALRHGAKVIVMAPDGPRSGNSSAITHDGPVTLRHLPDHSTGAEMYAVGGTPVDCVKLGLHLLKTRELRPALILSGINHGSNSAVSVTYSGTMGCAIEGAMNGVPSIGFSLLDFRPDADFSGCRDVIADITDRALSCPLPDRICLNVNIPAGCTPEGIKVVRAAEVIGLRSIENTPIRSDVRFTGSQAASIILRPTAKPPTSIGSSVDGHRWCLLQPIWMSILQ